MLPLKRDLVGGLVVLSLCCGGSVTGCSAVQRALGGGPTPQTLSNEIGALETATRGTRIIVDTLRNLRQLSEDTVDPIRIVLGRCDTACTSARTRLQAGDISGAASIIHNAQAEFANDAAIGQALGQAEQLLRDPNVRAALRVIRVGGHLD